MFPIPWNFPFRKKNGDMSTIGDVIGGAGSELPPHDVGDAGKLLGVGSDGKLDWTDEVNSEIQTLTNKLSDEVETRTTLGAHNLARPINSIVHSGLTLVTDNNGVTTISGTAESSGGRLNFVSSNFRLKAGTYKVVGFVSDLSKYISIVIHNASNNQSLGYWNHDGSHGEHDTFTLAQETECFMGMNTIENEAYGTNTYKFSFNVQLVSDLSTEYTPYAMTNRELTKRQIAYVDISFSGVTPTSQDNLYIYAAQLPLEIRNTAEIIGAVFKSGTMFGLSLKYNVTTQNVYLESATNGALNTTVRVFYYVA